MSVATNPLAEATGPGTWKATYPSGHVQTYMILDLDGQLFVTRDYYVICPLEEFELTPYFLSAFGSPTWERVA